MSENYNFQCGCHVFLEDGKINYTKMVRQLNYQPTCPEVWKMLGEGHTKGIFQLETDLGKNWCEESKPSSIDEMADLTAILRPGTLRAMLGNKSMTKHYTDRKNNKEEATPIKPELEEHLIDTQQILIYQEQTIKIAQELAGFTESRADQLRRAMGKKDAKLMASLRDEFVDGCIITSNMKREDATEIFDIIQASNRYAFNKSHSISYGSIGYLTAWVKYHFPLKFFCSWIKHYKDKQNQIEELYNLFYEAKSFDINILTPSLSVMRLGKADTSIDGEAVRLGLNGIKGIGQSKIDQFMFEMTEIEQEYGNICDWTWYQFLTRMGQNLSTPVMTGLICSGSLDCYYVDRQEMLYEYNRYKEAGKRSNSYLGNKTEAFSSLSEGLSDLLKLRVKDGGVNKNQKVKIQSIIDMINDPPQSIKDTPRWIIIQEKDLLNIPLTYNMMDLVSLVDTSHNCKQFHDLDQDTECTILAQITEVKEWKVKNGKNKGKPMCGLKLEDNTSKIDGVAFSEFWHNNRDSLYVGNILVLSGKKSERKSLIISRIHNIL